MSKVNNRQSFLGEKLDKVLGNCLVGVIGLGGGGSQVVQQLAHIGFRRYVLCDYDTIEGTNLNRTVGATLLDVENESRKLVIAVRMIRTLQPDAEIQGIPKRFQEAAEDLKKCDVIFGCLDGLGNRDQLERLARSANIPYIDIGMDVNAMIPGEPPRMSGQVIASLTGHPCMRCYGYINEKDLAKEHAAYGDAGIRPQVIWPNGVLSSTAIGVALNLLTNWTIHVDKQILYYEYDGNVGTVKPHLFYERELQRNTRCPHYPS
ncbi:HesA/MoeB/ThiF family protein [Cohnella panacarvi]|uniref:HesA/MoeB/ThiF family protein n=1 Tax=Cohnella panacarvi TaxID=400776 RepID=UPI00047909AF|nr:ThiF family adenylyltransferase [Cohnella panacarvi]